MPRIQQSIKSIDYRHISNHTKMRGLSSIAVLSFLYYHIFILSRKTTNPNPLPTGTRFGFICCGGDDRTRTDYLYVANVSLSRVSYAPIIRQNPNESCRILFSWWRRSGSNRLPLECHSSALPGELRPQTKQAISPLPHFR